VDPKSFGTYLDQIRAHKNSLTSGICLLGEGFSGGKEDGRRLLAFGNGLRGDLFRASSGKKEET